MNGAATSFFPSTDDSQQLMQQAMSKFEAGQHAEAAQLCQQALAKNPNLPEAQNMLGVIAHISKRYDVALQHMQRAAELEPREFNHVFNMAFIALDKGDRALAKQSLDKALKINPTAGNALKERLSLAFEDEEFEDAENHLRMALARMPNEPQLINVLIQTLDRQQKYSESVPLYRMLITQGTGHPPAFLGAFGLALYHTGSYSEAAAQLELAITLGLQSAEISYRLGLCHDFLGNYDKAEANFTKALGLEPTHKGAVSAKSLLAIKRSNFQQGFDRYSVRQLYGTGHEKTLPFPLWNGEPLVGKKLLLWAEQGVGDMMMFAGFLPYVLEQAASVTVLLYPNLIPMFERSFPKATFRQMTMEPEPEVLNGGFDYQAPMGNLLALLKDYKPASKQGYLLADPAKVAAFKAQHEALDTGKKIGISWFTEVEGTARIRNIPLPLWKPIFSMPGYQFISLQYGKAKEELQKFERETAVRVHYDASVNPVDDKEAFAAQIASLDGVLSIQNTTVHMAGALGVPTAIMLSRSSDFRWGVERTDNDWYRSVAVLRQPAYGDWTPVITQATQWLAGLK